jgi:hypothetical protein
VPDQFTPLFADLRRQAIGQVEAPGPAAAHRTVRRRRAATSSAAAAAMVLAAGATFAVAQSGGGDRDTRPAVSPSDSHAISVSVAGSMVPGASHLGLVAGNSEPVFVDVGTGRYRLSVGCSGPVPLPLQIKLTGKVERQDTIPCADAGVVRDYELTLTRPGVVSVRFGPDGHADAYALKLTGL